MPSRFIHVVAGGKNSVFVMVEKYSNVHFLYSSVGGHLGYFHILAIVNNGGMNTEVHLSF